MNNINLDDPKVYQQYDTQGMLTHIDNMPALCAEAWQMAMDFDLPPEYTGINKVVILGMGGSAIAGDLVSSLLEGEAKLPIIVHRDYGLPAFVDDNTLVIASSCSGATEETLFSFEQALRTGAKKLALTTGGNLKPMAETKYVPVFCFNHQAPPRAALPFSFLPILGFLQRLGFVSDKTKDVAETVSILKKLSQSMTASVPLSENRSKQLACRLHGRLPVIYGADILSQVAHRWKTQFNENSKAWAFYEVFPELNHNAVSGYKFPQDLASKLMIVLLRSSHLSQRIRLRYHFTCKLLEEANIDYQFVDGEGSSPLSQVMSTVLFGDYTSYYLAILNQVEPLPTGAIDYLKEQWKAQPLDLSA